MVWTTKLAQLSVKSSVSSFNLDDSGGFTVGFLPGRHVFDSCLGFFVPKGDS